MDTNIEFKDLVEKSGHRCVVIGTELFHIKFGVFSNKLKFHRCYNWEQTLNNFTRVRFVETLIANCVIVFLYLTRF